MPRAPRQTAPGGIYHVTARGNNKAALFVDDGDRHIFFELLARVARRHGWLVLAHCLMTTHYHLVIQVPTDGLSAGICLLNGAYARKANKRHGRGGHLFHDRFRSVSIARQEHLLEACRYVVLNPVRAGLCSSPEAWPWSSYRACAGIDLAPGFLADAELLGLFNRRADRARRAYQAFVSEGHLSVPGTVPEV